MGKRKEKYHPPEPNTGDGVHLVARAVLSFVPGASELFQRFITPPLEKKLEAWREQVGEALRQLEADKVVDLESLQSDERFISLIMQASTIAMRSHQEEKLSALRSAIINSTDTKTFKEDLQFVFLRFVDELTPSHLFLLHYLVKYEREVSRLTSYEFLYTWFDRRHPDVLSRELFKLMCNDLDSRGLIRISPDFGDYGDIYQASSILLEKTDENQPLIIVTEIAEQFLLFISKEKRIRRAL
jgi:hypothetical protein